jgi:ATP-dependent Zn protease
LGLGDFGPVWLGETRTAQLLSTPVYARIRAHVEEAEAQALSILSANRALLEQMAKALLKTRDLDEVEANHWLAKVEMVAIP